MVYLCYTILILVVFILQGVIFSYSFIYDIVPDLLLIIITILAINRGKTVGGTVGFITGFLQDLFSGGLFGINIISKTIVGYLFGFFRKNIYQHKFLVPPLLTFFATIINQLLVVFFTDYLISALEIEYIFKRVIIPLAICNSGLSLIISPIVYKIDTYLSRRKRM